MNATIKDVAKEAGVSTATVSNVLSGRKNVSEALKKRVYRAVDELNYRPNTVARSLKMNKSYSIGVIVPDISNPFFSEAFKSIQAAALKKDYQIMMYDSGEDAGREQRLLERLVHAGVDGIIDITSRIGEEHLKRGIAVPLILSDRHSFGTEQTVAFVHTDHFKSGKIAAEHLVDCGCEQFLCICGPVNEIAVARERLSGFREALREQGVGNGDLTVMECSYSFSDGYRKMTEFLQRIGQNICCGVYASSDIMAWGAVEACLDSGIRIPEEMSIVGNDNIWCSEYITNGMTTVENPAGEIGRICTEMMLEALEKDGLFTEQEVVIEPKLCRRKTT